MKKVLVILMLLSGVMVKAQEKKALHPHVGIDFFPYISSGYSVKVGAYHDALPKLEVSVEVFSMDIPELIVDLQPDNKGMGWTERVDQGIGVYLDWRLADREKRNGLALGLGFVSLDETVENKELNKKGSYWQPEFLLRANYKWFPFANNQFYINPYMALAYRGKETGDPQGYKLMKGLALASIYFCYEF